MEILLCLIAPHSSTACLKSNSLIEGPSIDILIRWFKFSVSKWFLKSLLILFMAEKLLSHSAVLTGITSAMQASFVNCGYIVCKVLFETNILSNELRWPRGTFAFPVSRFLFCISRCSFVLSCASCFPFLVFRSRSVFPVSRSFSVVRRVSRSSFSVSRYTRSSYFAFFVSSFLFAVCRLPLAVRLRSACCPNNERGGAAADASRYDHARDRRGTRGSLEGDAHNWSEEVPGTFAAFLYLKEVSEKRRMDSELDCTLLFSSC